MVKAVKVQFALLFDITLKIKNVMEVMKSISPVRPLYFSVQKFGQNPAKFNNKDEVLSDVSRKGKVALPRKLILSEVEAVETGLRKWMPVLPIWKTDRTLLTDLLASPAKSAFLHSVLATGTLAAAKGIRSVACLGSSVLSGLAYGGCVYVLRHRSNESIISVMENSLNIGRVTVREQKLDALTAASQRAWLVRIKGAVAAQKLFSVFAK